MYTNSWARRILTCSLLVGLCGMGGHRGTRASAQEEEDRGTWPQWGQNALHQGFVPFEGQAVRSVLADIVYDPFTKQEEDATGGDLLVHYQVPLIDRDNNIYMEFKSGAFTGNNS